MGINSIVKEEEEEEQGEEETMQQKERWCHCERSLPMCLC